MRPPRWALALTSLATAGGAAFVVGMPAGSAAVSLGRIEVSARGDAMYFEVNSGSIPASPTNNASSLYMETQLSSTGGGTATASTPFFGSTVQNLPGTANGVPPQFGLKDVAFPFTRLPGYITCRDNGEQNGQFGYGRVNAKCGQGSSEAHGSQGAPPEIPAPNQQETADAVTRITEDGTSVAEASGTVKGFVTGPLEIGNAIAKATVRHSSAGHQPEITSSTSGTFSVSGQKFGFTENGVVFAGQGMSQQDALKQADEALKAAGLRIEVAPATKSFDEVSGRTSYTIGGLKITSTQKDSQLVYILCRASITSVNESSDAAPGLDTIIGGQPSEKSGTTGGTMDSGPSAGVSTSPGAPVGAGSVDRGAASPSLTGRSASGGSPLSTSSFSSPSTSDGTSDSTATASAPAPASAPQAVLASPAVAPKTLGGFRPAAGSGARDHTGWLYLLIVIGAVVVFGGQAAVSRLAVNRG